MTYLKLAQFLCMMVFLFCSDVLAVNCTSGQLYVIRSSSTNVIDCSNPQRCSVRAPTANNLAQRWKFQCGGTANTYYIVNASGYVLDVNRTGTPYYGVLSEKDGSVWQQWEVTPTNYLINEAIRTYLTFDGTNQLVLGTSARYWTFATPP